MTFTDSVSFMVLTAANAWITARIVEAMPDAADGIVPLSQAPTDNLLVAVSAQLFVLVAIFAVAGLIARERDSGTLAWVESGEGEVSGEGVSGISHWRCSRCDRTFAHLVDEDGLGQPRCHYCGAVVDAEEVSRTEAVLNAVREKLDAEDKAEWDARTPEQESAFEAGRDGYREYVSAGKPPLEGTRIRSGPLAMTERCPYRFVPKAVEQHPLREWWCRGWQTAECEEVTSA